MLRKILAQLQPGRGRSSDVAALYLSQAAVTLVQLKAGRITGQTQIPCHGDSWLHDVKAILGTVAAGGQLQLVLSADFYQLVQIDKPALNDEELLQALPWQVKDLVNLPAEDILADYIDLPAAINQQAKINVVVASLAWLKQLTTMLDSLGLRVQSIQPEEWLAMQLLTVTATPTMLVVHEPGQELLIQIVRDGQLYFSRRARGFERLHLSTEAELASGLLDRLQLELQRSMDYFESQLKQAPVRELRLLLAQAELIASLLQQNGFSRVAALPTLPLAQGLTDDEQIQLWPAIAVLQQVATEAGR